MSTLSHAASSAEKRTNARYWIVVMFIVTSFNYGDRATLSIAALKWQKTLGLIRLAWGMFSPHFHGPMLLDRSRVAGCSIVLDPSESTSGPSLSGRCLPCCRASSISSAASVLSSRSLLRFPVGLAEAPSFPVIAASWPPGSRRRRGNGGGDFNSAQYFATVIFAPIMGWLTHEVGWSHVFFFMGGLGIVISFIWLKVIHEPNQHPGVNKKELEYIAEGGR